MKVKSSSVWIYTLIAAFGLSLAACGNSQKKREKAVQQRMAEQAMDTVTVDRKSTRLNSSHSTRSRMPSSA